MIRALPVSLSAAPGLGLSAVRAGLRATSGVALLTGTTVVESLTAADGAGRRRHDVEKIAQGIGGRRIIAIACTHAHDDHVNQAPALSKRFNAPVLLHPAEAPLWEMTHPDRRPDMELADGDGLCAGGSSCGCCTPRHSPARRASTPRSSTPCLPATPSSRAAWARRGGRFFVRHDHRVEPRQTSHPARRHHRPHRARRLHHRWGRGTPPRQVDRPPTLMSPASQFLEGST